MWTSNCWGRLVICIVLTGICASVYAQEKVYKWVDEDGVVNFSEEQPAVPPDVKVEVITTEPTPPPVPPTQTTVRSPPITAAQLETQSRQPDPEVPPLVEQVDITKMSLAELDRRCEGAREAMIGPRRAAEIENCIQSGTGDQDWCETFWADYGAPQRTKSGGLTPPMFHDLPECQDAWNERNRRGLYPE